MDRRYSFAVLLVVVSVSVIFGMILGGRLNAPPTMLAATNTDWLNPPEQASLKVSPVAMVSFADIAERALPAVVGVQNTSIQAAPEGGDEREQDPFFRWFFGNPGPNRRSVGFGSGFIISQDGYILTNNHVVADATRLSVELKNGDKYEAEVVGADPSIDLALIKIDPGGKPLPTLALGDSQGLRVGEWVLAIGNPLGLEYTVTVGVVSAKRRNFQIGETLPGVASFIQTDAAINKGNSGGPLVNTQGQVVGINSAILRGGYESPMVEGVGFALPINVARDAVRQILETGSVERGFLGITMNAPAIDGDAREYYGLPDTDGVVITEVAPDMPADRAGVRRNDVIRSVDGESITDNSDLLSKIATRRPGETVELGIFRGGKMFDISVTLISRKEGLAERRERFDNERERVEPVEEETPADGLGIEVDELTPAMRDRMQLDEDVDGIIVIDVDAASDAAEKGIQPSMVIVGINDRPVRDVSDWNRSMRKLNVGDVVMLELRFGLQNLFIPLKVPKTE